MADHPTTAPPRPRRHRWATDQTGSTLVLVPAGVLVLLVLAALALDFAVVLLGERRAADLAAAIANDAASQLDDAAFYGRAADDTPPGTVRIDPDAAARLARQRVAATTAADLEVHNVDLAIVDDDAVRVTVTGRVPLIFARALSPVAGLGRVEATATVELVPT